MTAIEAKKITLDTKRMRPQDTFEYKNIIVPAIDLTIEARARCAKLTAWLNVHKVALEAGLPKHMQYENVSTLKYWEEPILSYCRENGFKVMPSKIPNTHEYEISWE